MGLKSTADRHSDGAAFSKDILRVEICGPDEEHLTVIDVPGRQSYQLAFANDLC